MKNLIPIYKDEDQKILSKLEDLNDEIIDSIKKNVSNSLGIFAEIDKPKEFKEALKIELSNNFLYNKIETEYLRVKALMIPIDYIIK